VFALLMSLTVPGLNVSVKFTTQFFIIYETIRNLTLNAGLYISCNRLFHWCCRLSRALAVPAQLDFYARFKIGGVKPHWFLTRQITSPTCGIYLRGKKEGKANIYAQREI
jgi:hypothetical protein